jgi:hypothetical protein
VQDCGPIPTLPGKLNMQRLEKSWRTQIKEKNICSAFWELKGGSYLITCTTCCPERASTRCGVWAWMTLAPNPSWPRLDFPHAHNVPSLAIAMETTPEPLAATTSTLSKPRTRCGTCHFSLRTLQHPLRGVQWNTRQDSVSR